MKASAFSTRCLIAASIVCPATLASAAISDINSLVIVDRIFNDFPNSTLNITDNDFSEITFDESGFIPDGAPDFANRHAAYFSTDNVNPYAFQNDEGFDFSVDVTLTAGNPAQAKEAGIFAETFIGGALQFLAKTGTGEIVSFGGGYPFTSSTVDNDDGVEYDGLIYNPGDTINMRLIYTPGDGAANTVSATAEFFVNGVSAGAREMGNTENGVINDSNIGVYAQFPPQGFGDFATASFTNISISPLMASIITGDYNESGQVEQGDLDLVLQNWGLDTDTAGVPAGWTNDLPSGQIEQTELDGVLSNWGATSAPDFSGSSVPEPAAMGVLALGFAALRRRNQG